MAASRAGSITGFLVGLAAGIAVLFAFGFVDLWTRIFTGNDFALIWTGPRMLMTGQDPYDPATFLAGSQALSHQPTATRVFIYPGWIVVLLAPFGLLDIAPANVVATVLGLGLASIGLITLLAGGGARPAVCALIGFTLVASDSGIVAFYSGQLDFFIVGGLALMVAWSMSRPVQAGFASGVMLLKPQLFVLAGPALVLLALARSDRRYVYALGGLTLALAGLSTLVMPHWWSAWLAEVPNAQATYAKAATLPNALRDLFGVAGTAVAYLLLAGAIGAALAFRDPRVALPVWLMVGMAASPYVRVYDHVVGLVPLAAAAVLIGERRPGVALAVTAAGSFLLIVVGTLIHATIGNAYQTLSFSGLVHFALTVLILASLWPLRGARSVS